MAPKEQKDLLARLADAGEEALNRLASSPHADRITGVVTNMRDQVDALTSKVRGMDSLEKRLTTLEKKVEKLSKASASSTRKASSPRKTTTPKS